MGERAGRLLKRPLFGVRLDGRIIIISTLILACIRVPAPAQVTQDQATHGVLSQPHAPLRSSARTVSTAHAVESAVDNAMDHAVESAVEHTSRSLSAERARIELTLIGPRDHSGDRMGHVGLRLITTHLDQIYLFREDDQQRALWWRLLSGRVELVGKSITFNHALARWRAQDRAVTTYPLALSPADVLSLYRSLETRVHGRSVSPRYELLTSRDATLIRTLIDEVTRGAISRALVTRRKSAVSWRDELRFSYAQAPFAALSLELALGRGLGQERSLWELSAAPRHLIRLLHEVRYAGRPLLGPERQLHISSSAPSAGGVFHHIHWLICSFMILWLLMTRRASPIASPRTLTTQGTRRRVSHTLIVNLSVVSLGMLGLFAWWLSWQSDWHEARRSWLLWLTSPADLALYIYSDRCSLNQLSWRVRYLMVRGGMSALATLIFALYLSSAPTLSSLSIALILWLSALRSLKSLRVHVSNTNHNPRAVDSPDSPMMFDRDIQL